METTEITLSDVECSQLVNLLSLDAVESLAVEHFTLPVLQKLVSAISNRQSIECEALPVVEK